MTILKLKLFLTFIKINSLQPMQTQKTTHTKKKMKDASFQMKAMLIGNTFLVQTINLLKRKQIIIIRLGTKHEISANLCGVWTLDNNIYYKIFKSIPIVK